MIQQENAAEICERRSTCCGALEHSDAEGFCAKCRDATGFECSIHEVEWNDDLGSCPVALGRFVPDLGSGLRDRREGRMYPLDEVMAELEETES